MGIILKEGQFEGFLEGQRETEAVMYPICICETPAPFGAVLVAPLPRTCDWLQVPSCCPARLLGALGRGVAGLCHGEG